jgi:hypothetical protein
LAAIRIDRTAYLYNLTKPAHPTGTSMRAYGPQLSASCHA